MEMENPVCYFKAVKGYPEVQGGLSVFRLWQKHDHISGFCHLSYSNHGVSITEEGQHIIDASIPVLSVSESVLETESHSFFHDNNVLLESIVNDVLTDDVEIMDQEEGSAESVSDSLEIHVDEDRMLSQTEVNMYPVRLTQQQLLLLNSFSNRIQWLFDDISKLGVPMQTLQPHVTALHRMVGASRDIQCKLQSFVRKHRQGESSVTPGSERSVDVQAAEREKTRLQMEALNDKLQFFSSEYQRITELYLQEKSKNAGTPTADNEELTKQLEQYQQSINSLMKERESAQRQLENLKQQAEDLEYALRVLLETGTIIPPELDDRIQDAMNLFDDDVFLHVCLRVHFQLVPQ